MLHHPGDNECLDEEDNEPIINHGQFFDDGRRWCSGCQGPKRFLMPKNGSTWKEKACLECTALWPEYNEEFMQHLHDDEGFIDQFDMPAIN